MMTILFLICWWILWLVPFRSRERWKLLSYYGCMTVLLLYFAIGTIDAYYQAWFPQDTVNRECVIRIGPDEHFIECGVLRPGEIIRIVAQQGEWRKIRNSTVAGWITQDYLKSHEKSI